MVGTVLAWATLESTGSLWLAFIVARLIGFIVGAFIQRTVIQPIRVRAARRMTCMFTPLPQSQVSDLDQGPANRSRRVNLSPCSEREQSLPRTEMRDDTPDGRPCRPRKHLRNQREQTLSNRASGPCSRHHHSLFACADEEVLYRECFFIVLIASLGPFQPRNLVKDFTLKTAENNPTVESTSLSRPLKIWPSADLSSAACRNKITSRGGGFGPLTTGSV